jgi:hypothetical protein
MTHHWASRRHPGASGAVVCSSERNDLQGKPGAFQGRFALSRRAIQTLVVLLVAGSPGVVNACSVCLGNPDSPHTQGMNNAILFLLAVTLGVLAAFASFFIYLWRRCSLAAATGSAGVAYVQVHDGTVDDNGSQTISS